MKSTCDSLSDEKRKLTQRVSELENEIDKNKNSKVKSDDAQMVLSKLIAAETKIEELTEENNDLNKEIRNMEQEMRDNFRYLCIFKNYYYLQFLFLELIFFKVTQYTELFTIQVCLSFDCLLYTSKK